MQRSVLMLVITSLGIAAAAQAQPAAKSSEEWPTYGHDYGDTRSSPLTQITPDNVAGLKPAWTFHMRPPGSAPRFVASEDTPLVIDGIMYLSTPYKRVVALDAQTGMEKWAYQVPKGDQPATRGVSYWPGAKPEIVFGTTTGLLIALEADTGAPVKSFGTDGVVDLRASPAVMQGFPDGYFGVTSAPIIYKDLIITGSRVQEIPMQGVSGQVRAFDVRTGREVWHFNGVPQPGEKFHDTWEVDSWVKRSGVNVWVGMTLDASAASFICRSRRPHSTSMAAIAKANRCSAIRSSPSKPPLENISGTFKPCITICGTMICRSRHLWTSGKTANPFPPSR